MPLAKHPLSLLFLFMCCCFSTASAQKLKFQQLGIEEGLPASEAYNLLQDKQGYIWAFTEYGMVKHNGTRFVPACKNLPFEESIVYCVRESSDREIYIANSKAHIYRIKNDSAFLIKGIEKISHHIMLNNETIYDMVIDDSANIYFSTFYQSYKLEKKTNRVISITGSYREDSVSVVYKKINNRYFFIKTPWPVGKNYIRVLDEQDRQVCKIPYNNADVERDYIREKNGIFYFLNKHEIQSLDKQGKIKKVSFTESTINCEIAPNGHMWVGTRHGLYDLDADLNLVNHYYEDQDIADILFDTQGGMWVCSIERGIYYCKDIYSNYYDNVPEMSVAITMIKKVGDRLFIGTSMGNLFVKDRFQPLKKIDLKSNAAVILDFAFYKGEYLVGTKEGILVLDKDLAFNEKRIQPQIGKNFMSCYAFIDEKKDTLMGISASAIFKIYNPDSCIYQQLEAFKTRSIIEREKNEYFIGTTKGIFLYKNTTSVPSYLSFLQDKIISCLKTDRSKNLWIGTKGAGLYMLTRSNRLIKIKNTPASVVNNISFMNDTTCLLSTNKGLFVSNVHTTGITSPWRLLCDNEILGTADYMNEIYIATKQGLTTMNKYRLAYKNIPPLYLESVTVNDTKIDCSHIHLSHEQNDLYFNFDILEYGRQSPAFFYELQGAYTDKGKVEGTTLHLQHLEPGYYQLYVYLAGDDKVKKNILSIPVYIQPAFWQTSFFALEVVITTIALCVFFTGYFYDRLRKKQEHKTMITRLLIEQRLTALKAQINPHFISNSLTAIQQLILENNLDKANQYIAKFSLLIRYTLNYSDKSAAGLKNELDIIDLNIELEQLRFSDKFIFEKQIADNVDINAFSIPPLITQPLIENAIWHGLLPLKNQRVPTLILRITLSVNKLVISIIDNGVGRQEKTAGSIGNTRESKGTWLIKNRIGNLNRLHPYNPSEMVFIDLLAEDGSAIGTQVNLTFPLIVLDNLYDDKNEIGNY